MIRTALIAAALIAPFVAFSASASRPVVQSPAVQTMPVCGARACVMARPACGVITIRAATRAVARCEASARSVVEQGRRELDALIASIQ